MKIANGVVAGLILLTGASASAQSYSLRAITMIRTGWNADSFALVTAEPVLNPAHCPIEDGYVTDQSLPGYSTYYTAALAAFAANRLVQITVDDNECFGGRPKLIGLNLTNQFAPRPLW